jgi:hypothetical protein
VSIDIHQHRASAAELRCSGKLIPINASVLIWLYRFQPGAIAGRYLIHRRRAEA